MPLRISGGGLSGTSLEWEIHEIINGPCDSHDHDFGDADIIDLAMFYHLAKGPMRISYLEALILGTKHFDYQAIKKEMDLYRYGFAEAVRQWAEGIIGYKMDMDAFAKKKVTTAKWYQFNAR